MLPNGNEVTVWIAMAIEIILTFVFVTVILAVTSKKENSSVAGIVIGLTLTLIHLIGIPFTGTSVNPARSFAPALFGGWDTIQQVWLFLLAPMGGAALAALFYKYVLKK
jgi:aquaporin Z